MSPRPSPTDAAADLALLLLFGAVSSFFVYRFAKKRKLSSLACAMLPFGWVLVAAFDLGLLERYALPLKLAGVALGVFALQALFRLELSTPDGPHR